MWPLVEQGRSESAALGADFFTGVSCPGNLRTNKNGSLVFSTKRANLDTNQYHSILWLWQKNQLRRLHTPAGIQDFWWWNDSTLLAAIVGPAEKRLAAKGLPAVVFKTLPLVPGESSQTLFTLYADLEEAFPLPQGGVLLHAWWDPLVEQAFNTHQGDAVAAAEYMQQQASCTVWSRLPFWQEGDGVLSGKTRRLLVWEGKALRPLTPPHLDVEAAVPATDGKTVWLTARRADAPALAAMLLFRLDIATAALQDCTFQPLRLDALVPLKDGGLVAVGSDMADHGLNQNPAFYHRGADGSVRLLNGDCEYSGWASVVTDLDASADFGWHVRGQGVYFISTVGESSHLMRLDIDTGCIRQVSCTAGALTELAPAAKGWYAVAQRGLAPPEMWHIGEDGGEMPVTFLNDVSAYQMSTLRPLTAQVEGEEVRGWVALPPPGGCAQRDIPVLLYIHGGPKMAYGPVLHHEMQYLCAQGWAVVLCNPAGSDGRGDAFADIRGDYGGRDCRHLMGFLDAALQAYPQLNQQRMAVLGGSYGGFAVNWLIGHTQRFCAAVSQRSIANWTTMALLSDIGPQFVPDQAGRGSWQAALSQEERSPLAHAHKVRTPTLFIQGEEDCRCPWTEGAQMYAALKLNAVDARLLVFHGEGHGFATGGQPRNRLRRLLEIRDWLHRYLDP